MAGILKPLIGGITIPLLTAVGIRRKSCTSKTHLREAETHKGDSYTRSSHRVKLLGRGPSSPDIPLLHGPFTNKDFQSRVGWPSSCPSLRASNEAEEDIDHLFGMFLHNGGLSPYPHRTILTFSEQHRGSKGHERRGTLPSPLQQPQSTKYGGLETSEFLTREISQYRILFSKQKIN
ncbi:hypothetical protein Cgig2_021914 [Carnegiea gigantea]|uniref:Uncharacterized protein n=1 Tax=Carnegiea gigantea TaxID=171969 RepID=A0A9Q1JWI4_9CARY|nr:hypothetical protein Cgig2_021914 [Carnegiea gigantea]